MFGTNKTLIVTVVAISGLLTIPGHALSSLPGGMHEVRLVELDLRDSEDSAPRSLNLPIRGFRGLVLSLDNLISGDDSCLYELHQGHEVASYIIGPEGALLTPSDDLLNVWNGAVRASYPEWPAEGMQIRIDFVSAG